MALSAYLKKEQMNVLQSYETFANIVSTALGGKKKNTPEKVVEVQSAAHLKGEMMRFLNGK